MKKFLICFFIFVITGIGSAFLGVPGDATFIIGGICAVLYLVFSREKRNNKSSSSYSSSRSSGYSTKKYSSKEVAKILANGQLYACRFEKNVVELVEKATLYRKGSDYSIELPEYYPGTRFSLKHGYAKRFETNALYFDTPHYDVFYLMDSNKNIITY